MEIEILNYRDVLGKPSVMGEFTIEIRNGSNVKRYQKIHRCRLVRTKKGYPMITLPSYSEKTDSGEFKFFPTIEFDEETDKTIKKNALEEVKRFVQI
jgi:hypothetical protein